MSKIKKSEILFLYETKWNIPNGDPFTGEQRYDEESRRILVSDVRIKRYVRDYFIETIENTNKNNFVYMQKTKGKGSENRIKEISNEIQKKEVKKNDNSINEISNEAQETEMNTNKRKSTDVKKESLDILKKCIDVRLFGGISTKDGDTAQLTGPIQFSLLNASLNEVNLKTHQNTSVFSSKDGKNQGAIGTTSIVPYSIIQIHGWVNPKVAEKSELTTDDLNLFFNALWNGISGEGSSFSRSKIGQSPLLILEFIYKENKKYNNIENIISFDETNESKLVFTNNITINNTIKESIEEIKYYTDELNVINQIVEFSNKNNIKFKKVGDLKKWYE